MSGVYLLKIFAYIIIIIIVFIVLVLVIPFQLSFQMAVDGTLIEAVMSFGILYGLLKGQMLTGPEGTSFKLLIFAIPVYRSVEEEEEEKEKEVEQVEPKPIQERLQLLKKLQQPITRLVKAILSHTHLRELDCSIKAGLPDPYQTSMLCAIVYPLLETVYPLIPNGNFKFTPVFTQEVFNASLKGRLDLIIALILVPLLRLVTKKEFRKLTKG